MQGDRGRIYFWSKLRHAGLNSKEWVLGKPSLSLSSGVDLRVNIGSVFIACNYICSEIKNPIPLEGILCIERGYFDSITVDRTDHELLRDEEYKNLKYNWGSYRFFSHNVSR